MATLYDVPADELIAAVADTLASDVDEVTEPDWFEFAKSGVARELAPEQDDFWYVRGASLLRKVATDGPVGVQRLRTVYGDARQGTNRYRVRPNRKRKASGKLIRELLQQLDEAGYVEVAEGEGRQVTAEGRSLLDDTADDVIEELDRPELDRYA